MSINRTDYTVESQLGEEIQVESISRNDWNGLSVPCPVCGSTEFHHTRYESGHYGKEESTVILRTDYWNKKGPIRTVCKDCDETLRKDAVYDLLESCFTIPYANR